MKLSDDQVTAVARWVADGLKLSDIQSRIQDSFGVSLTYMDVRFLVDDLNLELKDQPKPVDNDLRNAPLPDQEPEVEPESNSMADFPEDAEAGNVSVSLHRLYKPGAVVSGEVTFSDGVKADWALDQIGRLTLNPSVEGYQPSEADVQDFQAKLSTLLQNQGF